MKRFLQIIIGVACVAACATQTSEYAEPNAQNINSIEDLQAYFTYNPKRDIVISAHRGGMMAGYPENCIESCEKTLSMMPTFFEIDFSFTKDSIMVLMHDLTLDRTTTGTGKISDYTYKEIQQFYLTDRDGNVTPYKIPTLKEMLEWGNGKAVFNFDNKYINTGGVTEEQKLTSLEYYAKQLLPDGDWATYHNIILSVRSIEEALFYWEKGIRNVMFCVEISSPEAYDAYDTCPIPWNYIMAYVRLDVNPDLFEIYNKLHENGVMIMTSITGSSDRIGNEYDRHAAYFRDLLAFPDIIETDYPSDFLDLPKSRTELHAIESTFRK